MGEISHHIFTLKINTTMAKKAKPIYSMNAFGENAPSAIYSCLKTLCDEWELSKHYVTVWRWLNEHDEPYDDGRVVVKKHELIKSKYTRRVNPHV